MRNIHSIHNLDHSIKLRESIEAFMKKISIITYPPVGPKQTGWAAHGHIHEGDFGFGWDSDEAVGNGGFAREQTHFGMLNFSANENRVFLGTFHHHLKRDIKGPE